MSCTRYRFQRRLADGIVALETPEFDTQLWTLGVSRKPARCAVCGELLEKGAESWRPLTFRGNRMERISPNCILQLENAAKRIAL